MTFHDPRFALDPAVTHLNHGSFGAVPVVVQAAAAQYQRQAEANPVRFNRVDIHGLVERARVAGGRFLGVEDGGLALVRNATEAIATVLASVPLGEGDEILVSNHGYGAVAIACAVAVARTGAKVRTVSFPVDGDPDAVVAAFAEGLNPSTKLVFVDAITSPTALVLPVVRVTALCRELDVPVFVDGAHAPGHIDTAPDRLGADFWVGNFHKWAYAPRGTAGLWTAPAWRERIEPLVPSWSREEGFPRWFDESGTDDLSGWISLPEALTFWRDAGGWPAVERSAALLDKAVAIVAEATGAPGQVSAHNAPLMRLVALRSTGNAQELYEEMSTRHRIECTFVEFDGRTYIRLSAQVYNREEDYHILAAALGAVA